MKYCAVYLTGHGKSATSDTFFGNFISSTSSPIIWFVLIMTISFVIVLLGVEKGVEKSSKVMMPILVVLSIIVAVLAIRMPGAFDGFIYYLKPDFSKFSAGTVLGALGQLFYSLSLAISIMITYNIVEPELADIIANGSPGASCRLVAGHPVEKVAVGE